MKVKLKHITEKADYFIEEIARVSSPKNQKKMEEGELQPGKLIRYLAKHGHWSPFEMVSACFEIETTRAISAQILRHRSFSFQEFSQRYAEVTDEIKAPEMRLKSENGNRQSSSEPTDQADAMIKAQLEDAKDVYNGLIRLGIAAETARMVLPMCSPTRLYMHGTIRSWIHYFEQRCSEHCQKEHREIAIEIRKQLAAHLPNVAAAMEWETPEINPFMNLVWHLTGNQEVTDEFLYDAEVDLISKGGITQPGGTYDEPDFVELDKKALSEGLPVIGWKSKYFRRIISPALWAFKHFQEDMINSALESCSKIQDEKLKEECIRWLTKRSDS